MKLISLIGEIKPFLLSSTISAPPELVVQINGDPAAIVYS
jgi:hypothetical protein